MSIDTRNPGNVKNKANDPWKGSIGSDSRGHAIFADASDGVRAMVRTLASKVNNRECPKPSLILLIGGHPNADPPYSDGYAPASDTQGSIPSRPRNDPQAYAAFVAMRLGIGTDEPIRIFNPDGRVPAGQVSRLVQLLLAMATYEKGHDYKLPLSQILIGVGKYHADFPEAGR